MRDCAISSKWYLPWFLSSHLLLPLLSCAASLSTGRLPISFSPQASSNSVHNTLSSRDWESGKMPLLVLCLVFPTLSSLPNFFCHSENAEEKWTSLDIFHLDEERKTKHSPLSGSLKHWFQCYLSVFWDWTEISLLQWSDLLFLPLE